MQGVLWKWTNYLSGWQQRWFVLENGVLSYYRSEDDVKNGCKGSIQMSVCDIVVHQGDNTRLDLIIPGQQHFYVKAATAQQRQRWLVAMGSCKATLANGKSPLESGEIHPDSVRAKKSELRLYCDLLMQQVHSVKTAAQAGQPEIEKLDEATTLLSATCDTFIHTLEECMSIANASIAYDNTSPGPTKETGIQSTFTTIVPTMQHRKGGSGSLSFAARVSSSHGNKKGKSKSVIGQERLYSSPSESHTINTMATSDMVTTDSLATCEVSTAHSVHGKDVIRTAPDVRESTPDSKKDNSSHSLGSSQGHTDKSIPPTEDLTGTPLVHGQIALATREVTETTGEVTGSTGEITPSSQKHQSQVSNNNIPRSVIPDSNTFLQPMDSNLHKSLSVTSVNSADEEFSDAMETKIPTFFSGMKPSFVDIRLNSDGGIPVEPFLKSCKSLVPIFDKMNSTAFAPVKMDFQGNIRKIDQKRSTQPAMFTTLQKIVLWEIDAKQTHLSNSATVALLWMKRGLEFIREIFAEVQCGNTDLALAVSNAYGKTLKPFHGWVIRGVFAMACKALPYYDVFISHLRAPGYQETGSVFVQSLMSDIEAFCTALDTILTILRDFYVYHGLDTHEQL